MRKWLFLLLTAPLAVLAGEYRCASSITVVYPAMPCQGYGSLEKERLSLEREQLKLEREQQLMLDRERRRMEQDRLYAEHAEKARARQEEHRQRAMEQKIKRSNCSEDAMKYRHYVERQEAFARCMK